MKLPNWNIAARVAIRTSLFFAKKGFLKWLNWMAYATILTTTPTAI